MSMDQLHAELESFIRTLDMFNESVGKHWDELQRTWGYADELWQDDKARQRFEKEFYELGSALKAYREQYGQRYIDFLMHRKRALDEYFG